MIEKTLKNSQKLQNVSVCIISRFLILLVLLDTFRDNIVLVNCKIRRQI